MYAFPDEWMLVHEYDGYVLDLASAERVADFHQVRERVSDVVR